MTDLDIYPAGLSAPEPATGWPRFGWRKALALHLGPAAVTFAAALALAPLLAWLGLPRDFSLTIAFAFVLTPIEFWLLLRAAHRATGRWSLRALPAVLAFRRPLGRWWLLVPVLFGIAVIIAVALTPVGNTAGGWLSGVYPHWLLPSYNSTAGFSRWALVLKRMAEGLSNAAISAALFITEATVEKHINSIFAKLGLSPCSEDNRRVRAVLTYLNQ